VTATADAPAVPDAPSGMTVPPFADVSGLEQALGCPFAPEAGLSLAGGVRADELEVVPTGAWQAAWEAGCHRYLVPAENGGRLVCFESLLGVVRAMSRRDLVISVGLGSTFLAALPVWIWGEAAQRDRVAELVLAREFGTAGITEDAAGSDLLATRTRAMPVPGGYVLDGRKWLIGNGQRSSFATVLAASEPSYGLFLIDFAATGKTDKTGNTGNTGVQRLPKVRTLGLRGHDLSGLEFRGCRVDQGALLGRAGRGIEMVSGMLQFTRTLVGGMSLGAADTALRIALRHARGRVLYGRPILALPPVRSLLARGFADMLAGECTALAAARGLDVAPQRMALWSAVAKYVVPGFCRDTIDACGEVLSARAYLREGDHAPFQKLARDAAITPVFEGTRLVQLETVRSQLASGARRRGEPELPLRVLFGFGSPVRQWAPSKARPSLIYGRSDEVIDLLDATADRLAAEAGERELARAARLLISVRDQIREALSGSAAHRSPQAYEVARRHCLVHAGACCLHTWIERREALGGLAADRAWLAVALRQVLERLGFPADPDREAEDRLVRWLEVLDDGDRAFSLVPLQLAAQYRASASSCPA
jgi:alkylation response protein AidB-like acyl-CoA dehydrogenase